VPTLSSGNYFVGVDKPEFASGEPTSIAGTANATVDFTLTTMDKAIAGVLYADANSNGSYDSGEEVPNGWAFAESSTGLKSFGPADGTGAFSIGVVAGTWKVFGVGDGYKETKYPEELVVAGINLTGRNIALSTDANWSSGQAAKPITPAQGGKVSDTGQAGDGTSSGTGVELTFPPNALGSSSSSGNVTAKKTNSVGGTSTMDPLAGKAIEITAKDSSGQPITNLSDYVDLEMVIYKQEVENDGMQNLDKLKSMKIGYWDETTNAWVYLETTRKAYHKDTADTEWTSYNGDGIVSGYVKFITDALGATPTFVEGTDYDDYKLVLKAKTNHFTVFAPGTAPDGVAPAAPAVPTQSSGNGTSVGLSWSAVTTNVDASAITDLYGYGIYRSSDGTSYSQVNGSAVLAGTHTYSDTTTTAWTSYYYKITAGDDDDLESAYSTALQVCSNKTVSYGTVAADCTITCDSGFTLTGQSCYSSGGGGGSSTHSRSSSYSTSVANTIASYTLSNRESTRSLDLAEPINLILSGGMFTRPIKLKNLITRANVEFERGTLVHDEDGNIFKGVIITPKPLTNTQIPALPEGAAFVKALKVGASDGQTSLIFNQPFTLNIPVDKVFLKPENVKILTYDEVNNKYKLVGDGGSFNNKIMSVKTNHMSAFVIVDTGAKNLDFLLETSDTDDNVEAVEETSNTLISIVKRKMPSFLASPTGEFKDIKGHWAESYISDMRKRGVIQGKSEGIYDPDSGLSRAELTKIAIKAFSIPVEETNKKPFPDVGLDKWYLPFVATAKKYGIINGYPNGFFKPNNPISRAEALKVIINTAGQKMELTNVKNPFFDVPENAWYASYVKFANAEGLIDTERKGQFIPGKTITRGEIAKVIVSLWKMMSE
jgi:hypothetical protein